jgi:hypothetical protein
VSDATLMRAVLLAADVKDAGYGFHRLVFKVDAGRSAKLTATVLISQDACRKLTTQLERTRTRHIDRLELLKTWARWEIGARLDQFGTLAPTVTITADDLDDSGAYATDLARSLAASPGIRGS